MHARTSGPEHKHAQHNAEETYRTLGATLRLLNAEHREAMMENSVIYTRQFQYDGHAQAEWIKPTQISHELK